MFVTAYVRSYELHAVGDFRENNSVSGEKSCETHVCRQRELKKFAVENKAVRKRRTDCESVERTCGSLVDVVDKLM